MRVAPLLLACCACGRFGFDAPDGARGGDGGDGNGPTLDDGMVPDGLNGDVCFNAQLRITNDNGLMSTRPVLAASPTGFALGWYQELADTTTAAMVQRITNSALDGPPTTVLTGATRGNPTLIWADNAWIFVGQQHYTSGNDDELTVARIDPGTGAVSGTARVGVMNRLDIDPAIAWSGADYGVVWLDRNSLQLMYRRLDAALASASADIIVAGNSAGAPQLAWDAGTSEYLAVFDSSNTQPGPIALQRIAQDGTMGTAQVQLQSQSANVYGLVTVPTGYAYSYTLGGASMIAVRGSVVADTALGTGGTASLVWTGTELGAVHPEGFNPTYVAFQRVDSTGTVVGVRYGIAATEDVPTVAFAQGRYGIAWAFGGEVYFAELCAF